MTDRRVLNKGFTLIELLVVIAIIALLVSILLPALGNARRVAKQSVCISNMKQYTLASLNYATDFKELINGYVPPEPAPTGGYILRRYTGPNTPDNTVSLGDPWLWNAERGYDMIRRYSAPENLSIPVVTDWVPQFLYSHLPMVEYLGRRLPEPGVVCPEDITRKRWQENPLQNPGSDAASARTPYGSSYEFALHSSFPDKDPDPSANMRQGAHQGTFTINGANNAKWRLGRRRISEVQAASRKAAWVEQYSWHTGKVGKTPAYYMNAQTKNLVSFFDGSVRIVDVGEANLGGYTLAVANIVISPPTFNYDAARSHAGYNWSTTEQAIFTPTGTDRSMRGQYRWTVGGLRGIDQPGR